MALLLPGRNYVPIRTSCWRMASISMRFSSATSPIVTWMSWVWHWIYGHSGRQNACRNFNIPKRKEYAKIHDVTRCAYRFSLQLPPCNPPVPTHKALRMRTRITRRGGGSKRPNAVPAYKLTSASFIFFHPGVGFHVFILFIVSLQGSVLLKFWLYCRHLFFFSFLKYPETSFRPFLLLLKPSVVLIISECFKPVNESSMY